jgi:pilus assembly protein CpaF
MSFFGQPNLVRNRKPVLADATVPQYETIDAQSIYRELIEFNLPLLEKMSQDEIIREIRPYVADYLRSERISLNQKELDIFAAEIVDEMTGYGPIEPLLKDPTINDILINSHQTCYVERFGKLERTKVHFKDEAHLLRIINKIVAGIGRRVDESSPMVDARLPDGSRVNIAIRPISIDGPMVSIRAAIFDG